MATQNKQKLIQILQLDRPRAREEVRFFETRKTEPIPLEYKQRVNDLWQRKHNGNFSSPLATLDHVVVNSTVDVMTGLSDFKHQMAAYTLSTEGDYTLLDLVNTLGNETMLLTNDGLFIIGCRDPNIYCGGEYDFGGGLAAVWYAAPTRLRDALKETTDLPPGTRFSSKDLTFRYNDMFEQAIRTIPKDYGVRLGDIDMDSISLIGFARDPVWTGPSVTSIFARLNLDAEQYIRERTEMTSASGRAEHQQHNFLSESLLLPFILGEAEEDSLGNQLHKHHKTGKVEVTGTATGASIAYLLQKNLIEKRELTERAKASGLRLDFIQTENGRYIFRLPEDLL